MDCMFLRGTLRRAFRLVPTTALAAILIHPAPAWAGEWVIETVECEGDVGRYCSLAVDSGGHLHVCYQDATDSVLRYAYRDGLGWAIETADSGSSCGYLASTAVDVTRSPHLSYTNNWGLQYAFKDTSGSHIENLGTLRWCASIDVSQGRDPHITYWRWGDPPWYYAHVGYLWRDASGWHGQVVDSGTYDQCSTSLKLDTAGWPHLAYGSSQDSLTYAWRQAGAWSREIVAPSGSYPSLALDALGRPDISYYGTPGANLCHARRDPAGWSVETVDSVGNVGKFASLALDPLGYPHISYEDATNQDLKYAYKDTRGWHIEVVDSIGDVGQYCSLALDRYGRPHISYYDATNGDLKYAVGQPSWMYLSGTVQAGQLKLTWNPWPNAAAYWVYGASNLTYFTPGLAPGYQHRLVVLSPLFQTWSSPSGIGDPSDNWTYLVLAVDGADQELSRSNRVGEWDFSVEPPREFNAPDRYIGH